MNLYRPGPQPDAIHDPHQIAGDTRFRQRMTCIANHVQLALRPGARQFPGRLRWADHIVPPLHNVAGNMRDAVDILQDPTVLVQKATIDEIVVFKRAKARA